MTDSAETLRDVRIALARQFSGPYRSVAVGDEMIRARGLSSDAMVVAACIKGTPTHAPSDPSDLLACEMAYLWMPPSLQSEALPWLEGWRIQMRTKWPQADWTRYESIVARAEEEMA